MSGVSDFGGGTASRAEARAMGERYKRMAEPGWRQVEARA
jgi:hypothetical protein